MNIKARIKRNLFIEVTGQYYQDFDSEIVKELNLRGKDALLGIKRNDGVYTIIGKHDVFFSLKNGSEFVISHVDLIKILTKNAMSQGSQGNFEYVKINEDESIWFENAEIMNVIWNTIIFLEKCNENG
jgi:hypothetical protein